MGWLFHPMGSVFTWMTASSATFASMISRRMPLSNGRIFAEEPGAKGDGVPDGMKLDAHGNMFVTGPKGIWVWDAQGRHLGTIVMPEQPANLTWGDADYGTLYITATTSVYRLHTETHGFVPYLPLKK